MAQHANGNYQQPFYKRKWFIIVAVLVVLSVLGALVGGDESSGTQADISSNANTATKTSVADTIESTLAREFVVAYNEVSDSPIESISTKGSSYIGKSYGYSIQMIELEKTKFLIEIQSNGDYQGMRKVFVDSICAFDQSAESQAEDIFTDYVAQLSPSEEDVVSEIDELQLRIYFSPENDIEAGHIQIVYDLEV